MKPRRSILGLVVLGILLTPALAAAPTAIAPPGVAMRASLEAPAVAVGDTMDGSVTLKNTGSSTVSYKRVVLAARPPDGTRAGGPYMDFGTAWHVSLAPGESRTLAFGKTFAADAPKGAWFAYPVVQTYGGAWFDGDNVVDFHVAPAGDVFSLGGEDFASRLKGGMRYGNSFWGGAAWNAWSNTVIADSFTPSVSGVYEMRVWASGTSAKSVNPQLTAEVGGQRVGSWSVDPTRVVAYSGRVTLDAGAAVAVNVAFTNDYYSSATREDRNLYVDHVMLRRVGDAPAPTPDPAPTPESAPANGATLRLAATSVPTFGLAEAVASFKWDTTANPFDPRAVNLVATIKTPSGMTERVPGFWYVPQSRSISATGWETVTSSGGGEWRIRYAPRETGTYSMSVTVDGSAVQGTHSSAATSFSATSASAAGFARVSTDGAGFVLDDGKPFVPIGMNLQRPDWRHGGGAVSFEKYFTKFEEHGMNHARVWVWGGGGLGLEWTKGTEGYEGLGRYHQANAWKLDRILQDASAKDVRVQLVAYTFHPFDTDSPWPEWHKSPWNAANGGTLTNPSDVFTHAETIRLSEQYLRYLAARYGAYDSLFAWELWNEGNFIDGYAVGSQPVVDWHARMARVLRANDPAEHPIGTSFGWSGDDRVNALPEMEYTQTHRYHMPDAAALGADAATSFTGVFGKPSFVGEIGESGSGAVHTDITGRYLHAGLWGSTVGSGRAAASTWWWDDYVDARNLYPRFGGLSKFMHGLPELDPSGARVTVTSGERANAENRPGRTWAAPLQSSFDVLPDGRILGFFGASTYVAGSAHPDMQQPLTMQTRFDRDTTMVVRAAGAHTSGGNLRVTIDGSIALDTTVTGSGAWRVTVPAGAHTVVVSNHAQQWWRLASIDFEGVPRARVFASQSDAALVAWVQDWGATKGSSSWPTSSVTTAKVTATGLRDGSYRAEWWDTWSGSVKSTSTVTVSSGRVTLGVPAFTGDVALRLTKA